MHILAHKEFIVFVNKWKIPIASEWGNINLAFRVLPLSPNLSFQLPLHHSYLHSTPVKLHNSLCHKHKHSEPITKVPEAIVDLSLTSPNWRVLSPSWTFQQSLCYCPSSSSAVLSFRMDVSLLKLPMQHPTQHPVISLCSSYWIELNWANSTPAVLTRIKPSWDISSFAPSLYLVQLQGLPILGPDDKEQWGVGTDRAPDHSLHAYGQGCLRRHCRHLGRVWEKNSGK